MWRYQHERNYVCFILIDESRRIDDIYSTLNFTYSQLSDGRKPKTPLCNILIEFPVKLLWIEKKKTISKIK